jgi:hypothetical protein
MGARLDEPAGLASTNSESLRRRDGDRVMQGMCDGVSRRVFVS